MPGVVETREALGETTLVVDPARLVEACTLLRDEHGFNFLADIAAADYLGWGEQEVAGYIGTAGGPRHPRARLAAGSRAFPTPSRSASRSRTTCSASPTSPARVRVQVWLDDGEPIASVIPVWPAADWFEREAWDMMGIRFEGHANLVRILMPEDWEGHPLRKDYPLGGEPVRFSDED